MAAAARRGRKPLAEVVERLGADALDGDEPFFFEPGGLAREGMEFAVACQDARASCRRQRREQTSQEILRVGRERDRRRI
ncbi:MAG TPA: hypothetical protein VE325_07055, partial [Burkholderiales bacterium]|nr:hypothetical protein [Burkholderiales bacterium]